MNAARRARQKASREQGQAAMEAALPPEPEGIPEYTVHAGLASAQGKSHEQGGTP